MRKSRGDRFPRASELLPGHGKWKRSGPRDRWRRVRSEGCLSDGTQQEQRRRFAFPRTPKRAFPAVGLCLPARGNSAARALRRGAGARETPRWGRPGLARDPGADGARGCCLAPPSATARSKPCFLPHRAGNNSDATDLGPLARRSDCERHSFQKSATRVPRVVGLDSAPDEPANVRLEACGVNLGASKKRRPAARHSLYGTEGFRSASEKWVGSGTQARRELPSTFPSGRWAFKQRDRELVQLLQSGRIQHLTPK